MPRGRGKGVSKRGGRGKSTTLRPAQPNLKDEPVTADEMESTSSPPVRKPRKAGRPSRFDLEEREKQHTNQREMTNVEEEEIIEEESGLVNEEDDDDTVEDDDDEHEQTLKRRRVSFSKNAKAAATVRCTPSTPRHEDADTSQDTSMQIPAMDDDNSCGLHVTTMQIKALQNLVSCRDCGQDVVISVRPTTKGMISEFVVTCGSCQGKKVTITPNLVRERKRKREIKGLVLQKTENINYAHVAAFLDNGLGYSGLRHYCKYFNARCLNEATFIVYARQVIQDVVNDTEDNLQSNARIVRKVHAAALDDILDITVSYTTTYHQWGSDFCLVAGAVIELQTGLVLDYDVSNMYCHVCKINSKRIISMTPSEMTEWFNKHQSSCEIREWCDELDHDGDEGLKDIEPKYLECFVAKKIWSRSVEKFGFRYSTLIHESDETVHTELLRTAPYGDTMVMIDSNTNCFTRRKSEHARTAFQNKLKSKCPRERVQTKDRIMYVYSMSIPEYNRFAVGSNIKLRHLVRQMEMEDAGDGFTLQVLDTVGEMGDVIPSNGERSEVIYTTTDEDGQETITYEIEGTETEQILSLQKEVDAIRQAEESESGEIKHERGASDANRSIDIEANNENEEETVEMEVQSADQENDGINLGREEVVSYSVTSTPSTSSKSVIKLATNSVSKSGIIRTTDAGRTVLVTSMQPGTILNKNVVANTSGTSPHTIIGSFPKRS